MSRRFRKDITWDGETIVRTDKERKTLVINTVEQPWQVVERKRQMKASAVNMGWNERREARELRRQLETAL